MAINRQPNRAEHFGMPPDTSGRHRKTSARNRKTAARNGLMARRRPLRRACRGEGVGPVGVQPCYWNIQVLRFSAPRRKSLDPKGKKLPASLLSGFTEAV